VNIDRDLDSANERPVLSSEGTYRGDKICIMAQKGSVDEATKGLVTDFMSVLFLLQLPGGLLIYSEDKEVLVLV
jgi:hypothetical protein